MKTLVFPTTFGPQSERATDIAVHLASRMHARLLLYHAWEYPPAEGVRNTSAGLIEDGLFRLEELERTILMSPEGSSLKVDLHNRSGRPVEGIAHLARDMAAGLIVMGTDGVVWLDENFMGTTTSQVIRTGVAPVLAIPSKWQGKTLDTCLIAINLDTGVGNQYDEVFELLGLLGISHTLVHISTEKEKLSATELETRAERVAHDRKCPVKVVRSQDAWSGLNTAMHQIGADLLVMVSRKRSFWSDWFTPSLTRKMAKYGEFPLMACHEAQH
jgi:nucleotide-binding universal stress UspA family protein